VKHGNALKRAFNAAVEIAHQRREDAGFVVHGALPGIYVQFESQPGFALELESLENKRQGIELVAVSYVQTKGAKPKQVERATVFVPDGKVKHFVSRFEAYAHKAAKKEGERRYEKMLDPVKTLRLSTLQGLWTEPDTAFPTDEASTWWEIWLRRHDGQELSRFLEFAALQNIEVGGRRIQFDERIVIVAKATPSQLSLSLDVLNDLAEVRLAKWTAADFVNLEAKDQADWANELLARTRFPSKDAPSIPAVCILDTGVNRGHPLLEPVLADTDCHSCEPSWGTHDHDGHGTEMAGLALYGDLAGSLSNRTPRHIRHILESVKILPPKGQNKPDVYGSITAEATSRVEVTAPKRSRFFSLAVTAKQKARGQPSSWSAAIDALAAGRDFDSSSQGLVYTGDGSADIRRLFFVSAGNVDKLALQVDHLDRSEVDPVQDPAQAWNALTVGAFTDKISIQSTDWEGWEPVAPAGDLSPWSTTGVTFKEAWPHKPDVVFEGGNIVKNAKGEIDFPCPDLCLLTTNYKPSEKQFALSWATSAATAQAARFAATILADYPELWPESVRALMVHSSEWTRSMQAHLKGASGKRARARLVRRYGFGVPQMDRALRSAKDSLTLIAQGTIRPFDGGKLREMHLFELPWPAEILQSLGETPVRLRVTLSYFIEPNPGNRGWRNRHRYASHGLRFEVKRPTESVVEFRKRLNNRALEEEESKPPSDTDSLEWYLGEQARNHGSIHSDILHSFAADLAERGVIGICPVSGWWKDQKARDRSQHGARYSLVVSIDAPGIETDIWTPVAQQVGVPVEVET
jgi:hypothetical protein